MNEMHEYDFEISVLLPNPHDWPPERTLALLERARTSNVEDATPAVCPGGVMLLDFCRSAPSSFQAVIGTLTDVREAFPEAELLAVNEVRACARAASPAGPPPAAMTAQPTAAGGTDVAVVIPG